MRPVITKLTDNTHTHTHTDTHEEKDKVIAIGDIADFPRRDVRLFLSTPHTTYVVRCSDLNLNKFTHKKF